MSRTDKTVCEPRPGRRRSFVCVLLLPVALVLPAGCESESEPSAPQHLREGDPCTRGVETFCCINNNRALVCSPGLPGTDGSWTVQNDAGCPCACVPNPPMCPGAPDNYALPKDAQ